MYGFIAGLISLHGTFINNFRVSSVAGEPHTVPYFIAGVVEGTRYKPVLRRLNRWQKLEFTIS